MNRKRYGRIFLTVFALLIGMIAGIGSIRTEAASKKTIRSLKVIQKGKNIAKKTLKMKTGTTKTLKVKAKPAIKKKNIKFKSSAKKVAAVSAKGKLTAKKKGTAKISITVKKKGYRKKTTWVKVSVSTSKTKSPEDKDTPTPPPAAANLSAANVGNTSATPPTVTNPPEEKEDDANSGKILVAYFSWSGTSERIAKNIIAQTGADSFRIERETPYSTDYNTVAYGDAQTEAETNARPPIKNPLASLAEYEKIVLCYPIWWHTAPMTVGTFLENYDFTGKTIYPISQSASMDTSQYEASVEFIRNCAKGAIVEKGLFTKEDDQISSYVQNTVLK